MNEELFLKMLDAGLKKETLSSEEPLDKEFLVCAKEQTFLSWLYPVFKKDDYKKYYIQSCVVHESFAQVTEILTATLNKAGVNHVFMKGTTVKYLYPDVNLRMQGDIDVLVGMKNFEKAKEALIAAGFVVDDNGTCAHHIGMYYGKIEVELHRSLFDEGVDKKYDVFFGHYEGHIHLLKDCRYDFDDEFNFVYLLAHYAKHLRVGAGLRECCDLYLFLTKKNMDEKKIREYCDYLGLTKFFETVLTELHLLFGYTGFAYEENKYAKDLILFSLRSGIHGYGHENNITENQLNSSADGHKFKFLLKKLFLPARTMFRIYPWTKSIILLPFGYVYRFFYHLIHSRRKVKTVLKAEKKEENMFEKVGL